MPDQLLASNHLAVPAGQANPLAAVPAGPAATAAACMSVAGNIEDFSDDELYG